MREEIELALARRLPANGAAPWMSTDEVAALLSTTPGAIRQRFAAGWLADDSVRDGKRRFFRREAVLAELERRRDPPSGS